MRSALGEPSGLHHGCVVTWKGSATVTSGFDDVGVAGVMIVGCAAVAEGDGELKVDEEIDEGKLLIHPRSGLIIGAADNEVGDGPMKDGAPAFEG